MTKNKFFLKTISFSVALLFMFIGTIIFSQVTYAFTCPQCGSTSCSDCSGGINFCGCSASHDSSECCFWDASGNCTAYYKICDEYCQCCSGESAAQWCPGGGNGGEPTPTPRPCGDCFIAGCGITAMFIDESKKFAVNSCKLDESSLAENQKNHANLSVAESEQNKVMEDEIFAEIIDKSNKTSPLASLQVLIDQVMQKTFSIFKFVTKFFSKLSIS